jgi:hypothetical protein
LRGAAVGVRKIASSIHKLHNGTKHKAKKVRSVCPICLLTPDMSDLCPSGVSPQPPAWPPSAGGDRGCAGTTRGGFLVYGRSGLGQSATGEPAPDLLRRAYAVIHDGDVDIEATHLIRVARQPKPHVLDLQHRRALLTGDRVTQRLMPRRGVLMKIVQPERKVEAPDVAATGKLKRDVIPLLLDESGWARSARSSR